MRKSISKVYLGLIYLFLYAPIIIMIVYSFNSERSRANWGGFSLKWYRELFHNDQIRAALYNTLTIAFISAVIATVVGTLAAIGIHYMRGRMKPLVMNITYLPVINPDIVTGVSLMLLFVFLKVRLGWSTMLLAHLSFNIPYVIMSVLPKLTQLDTNLVEAANDLGASNWYALRHVIIPNIMPGIISGFIIAITLSIDDFVISFFNTGSGVNNLSIYIYSTVKTGIKPTMNALSAIMFIAVMLLLIIINIRSEKEKAK
ncbi:MAG: ABC transporter permease [Eubacteriales bacterium]|nr:ABC transporter permease [Eubacteriales bacterium]